MKVSELIAALQGLDQELEVRTISATNEFYTEDKCEPLDNVGTASEILDANDNEFAVLVHGPVKP